MRFGSALRHHAQALDHSGNDDVLLASIEPLGVLADNHQIDAGIGAFARQATSARAERWRTGPTPAANER